MTTSTGMVPTRDISTADASEQLRIGLNRFALKRGRFVLASGAVSDYYVDIREISLRGRYLNLIGQLLWERIKPMGADAVGGLTLGADPIVAIVTAAAAESGVDCPALIIRKETKDHGSGKRIEGPFQPGMKVAIVEDVTTTGNSAKSAAEAVIAAGGSIVGVFTVLNRTAGADRLFAQLGWPFEAIFSKDDLDL